MRKILFLIGFIILTSPIFSKDLPKPRRENDENPCLPVQNCDGVPLDENIIIIGVSGLLLGVYFIRKKNILNS